MYEIPEETLQDVMWEIAECWERQDLVDGRALRHFIEGRIGVLDGRPDLVGQGKAAISAYRAVLAKMDGLSG